MDFCWNEWTPLVLLFSQSESSSSRYSSALLWVRRITANATETVKCESLSQEVTSEGGNLWLTSSQFPLQQRGTLCVGGHFQSGLLLIVDHVCPGIYRNTYCNINDHIKHADTKKTHVSLYSELLHFNYNLICCSFQPDTSQQLDPISLWLDVRIVLLIFLHTK